VTDILDTIDGALDDWTSPDATRWAPAPPAKAPLAPPPGFLEITPAQADAFAAQLRQGFDQMRTYFQAVARSLSKTAEELTRFFHDANPRAWHQRVGIRRRHCRRCVPASARTLPLCIDGHEYRRRQRARVRRKR
jgi:hypothetical protein